MAVKIPIDLKKPTVFILGAGASSNYGLPLAEDLKKTMILSVSSSGFRKAMNKSGLDITLFNEFATALSYTSHPTIDIFLEKMTRFRSLGAYLIAYTLLPLEREDRLFPANNWYKHLYDVIGFENAEPDSKDIKFVTLNYDRSLEHFLMNNYKYNCPEASYQIAESKARNINVIHAHGSLGSYPEIPYGKGTNQPDVLRNAAEGIRIVSDKLEDSDDFNLAKNAILSADNIIFIGFGYDPLTLEKLISDPNNMDDKRILGTTFGLQASSTVFLQEYFKGKFDFTARTFDAENFTKQILPLS